MATENDFIVQAIDLFLFALSCNAGAEARLSRLHHPAGRGL